MDNENFKAFADSLFTEHETRMWRKEKDAFLEHCKSGFSGLGYSEDEITVREDRNMLGLRSKNLLVGPPDADILITAHYDTPGKTGLVNFASPLVGGVLGGIIFVLVIFALGFADGFLQAYENPVLDIIASVVNALILVVIIGSFFLKNKHNHNDNTSGVLGVFNMAALVAGNPGLRQKCAFVLFDHEEVMPGLLGSRAFAKWRRENHPGKVYGMVINLDCIGNGDVLTVMKKKNHEGFQKIADFLENEGFEIVRTTGSMFSGTSDHEPFPGGVSLLCKDKSLLGFLYFPRIHTARDTICDLEKIKKLCAAINKYIAAASTSIHIK